MTGYKNMMVWAGYSFYALLVLIILLYLKFPAKEMIEPALRLVNGQFGPYILSAENLRLALFPLGVTFMDGKAALASSPQTPFLLFDELSLSPDLFSFGSGMQGASFRMRAFGGAISGRLLTDQPESLHGAYSIDIDEVDLGTSTALTNTLGRKVSGKVSGRVRFDGDPNRFTTGVGEARLSIDKGSIGLVQPVLGFSEVPFNEAILQLNLTNGEIELVDGALRGEMFDGSLKGRITPAEQFSASKLYLSGNLAPHEKMFASIGGDMNALLKSRLREGKFFFNVSGTMAAPFFEPL